MSPGKMGQGPKLVSGGATRKKPGSAFAGRYGHTGLGHPQPLTRTGLTNRGIPDSGHPETRKKSPKHISRQIALTKEKKELNGLVSGP